MLRSTFVRALPYVAIFLPLVHIVAGCGSVAHEVGADDAGSTTEQQECTTRAGVVCHTANVPAGCTVGASSCTDGAIQCGQVTCPNTDCNDVATTCPDLDLAAGCTVGPASCSDGKAECGVVTCTQAVDAGSSCAGQVAPPCAAAPPGCDYVGPECVDGHLGCGSLVCSDAGTDAGDACEGQVAPPCVAPPSGCNYVGPECVDGHLGCGTVVCNEPPSFACGSTMCDPETEYCQQNPSCAISLDGGSTTTTSCQPISNTCEGKSDPCQCVLDAIKSKDGPVSAATTSTGSECTITFCAECAGPGTGC